MTATNEPTHKDINCLGISYGVVNSCGHKPAEKKPRYPVNAFLE